LIVESPITGAHCFEWNSRYNLWMAISKEFHLSAFLKEEFIDKVKGTFNF
tara:strand:+ start:441 stop:590 length:150 start_codon:yes stop_codon:yes gene_type:complete